MRNAIIAVSLILMIFVSTPISAQITTDEKEYRKLYLEYYSGRIPTIPANNTKTEALLDGDETAQKALLKTFIKDVILPRQQIDRNNIQNTLIRIDSRIAILQDYVK